MLFRSENTGDIYSLVDRSFRVAGNTEIEKVNAFFEVTLPREDGEFDTIGGMIAHAMGHVPTKGEHHDTQGLRFEVMHSKSGVVKWFRVKRLSV